MIISSSRIVRSTAVLAVSCLLSVTCRAADNTAKIRAIVDAAVRPVMAEHDLPGVAVGITVGGKAYVFNYGVASREKNIPVSDATLFELGSVTKPLTATLVSYAQVLGKLSLDDHPSKFIPQLKGTAIDKASVLNLGTYTAGGLPQQVPDEVADSEMEKYFQQWVADAPPGTQRRYSNPSLGLFGHLAALSMKGDFADLMEQQLFAQLGMKNSYIVRPGLLPVDYAWGYDKANKPVRMQRGVLSEEGGGGISTAADLIRLLQANIAPSALPMPMRRAVEGTHIGYFVVGPMVQGLGWEQYPYPVALDTLIAGNSPAMSMEANAAKQIAEPRAPGQPTLFNKTGSTRGFGNYVAFVPQKKLGVVFLANKSAPAPARVKVVHTILTQLDALAQ
jgi:beta-lactamase class C